MWQQHCDLVVTVPAAVADHVDVVTAYSAHCTAVVPGCVDLLRSVSVGRLCCLALPLAVLVCSCGCARVRQHLCPSHIQGDIQGDIQGERVCHTVVLAQDDQGRCDFKVVVLPCELLALCKHMLL